LAFATAWHALSRCQEEIRREVHGIDLQFETWREKLAQLLAITSAASAIPLPSRESHNAWLAEVWNGVGAVDEGRAMYRYLSAAMKPADRLALLDDLLRNLLEPPSPM
jgi:hypothetical protein